jgi:hypothetical protein
MKQTTGARLRVPVHRPVNHCRKQRLPFLGWTYRAGLELLERNAIVHVCITCMLTRYERSLYLRHMFVRGTYPY